MADEEIISNPSIVVAPAAPEPVVETQGSLLGLEPVAEKPVEIKTEVVAPVEKAEEAPKVEEKPKEEVAEPVKEPEKAAKTPKEEAKKPEEKAPEPVVEDKPVVTPTFEPFVIPEGAKVDGKRLDEITSMLGSFEIATKADHAQVQKFGQAILDYGVAAVQEAVAQARKQGAEYWDQKHKEDMDAFIKDPEIGGNRKDTTLAAANQFIATHVGTPEQQKQFRALLVERKLDNNLIIIRALANANLARREGTPLVGTKPVPAPQSKLDKWYGGGARNNN